MVEKKSFIALALNQKEKIYEFHLANLTRSNSYIPSSWHALFQALKTTNIFTPVLDNDKNLVVVFLND